jgi:hypothetical protein
MLPAEPLALRSDPQWYQAAQVLIDGCAYLKTSQERIRLLEVLCDALGPQLYPALIGVLCVIGERGSPAARKAVANTLVEGLQSGRVPTGRRAAWGSSTLALGKGPAMTRSLGPIEYLCAWYDDPGPLQPISASNFDTALKAILGLVSETEQARQLYCARLLSIAHAPVDGALTRRALDGMRKMAESWLACGQDFQSPVSAYAQSVKASHSVGDIAGRFMGASHASGLTRPL